MQSEATATRTEGERELERRAKGIETVLVCAEWLEAEAVLLRRLSFNVSDEELSRDLRCLSGRIFQRTDRGTTAKEDRFRIAKRELAEEQACDNCGEKVHASGLDTVRVWHKPGAPQQWCPRCRKNDRVLPQQATR